MPVLLYSYVALTWIMLPFMWLMFRLRAAKGREDPARISERKGLASCPRPDGRLVWFHAASVGEVNSVLPLIKTFLDKNSTDTYVLLTSGTLTSAEIVAGQSMDRLIHHYVPVDQPLYAERFLQHWRPDMAAFVESELWPNLLRKTFKRGIPMILVNARISVRSFNNWSNAPDTIRVILNLFTAILVQDELSKERVARLGGTNIHTPGNLKLDAPPLKVDPTKLQQAEQWIEGRRRWLAASTHQGEEIQIAQTHMALAEDIPDLLTVIVPRHPQRGDSIRRQLEDIGLKVCQRSKAETPGTDCNIYLADTLGELGLFYRLCGTAFIGGSMIPHGGQNPVEAALVGCAIITGPYIQNFTSVYDHFIDNNGVFKIRDQIELTSTVNRLIKNKGLSDGMKQKALETAESHGGANANSLKILQEVFAPQNEVQT